MKYVLLIGDGMGDLPLTELDGATPLERAATPAMDAVATAGDLFTVQTIPAGFPPGSDVANLSLMGYAPQECYTGRAPLEAASMGIALAADEIAFRCNLVTLEKNDGAVWMRDYSAGHISTEEAGVLLRDIDAAVGGAVGGIGVRFHPGVGYRHLCVHQGTVAGLDTVPPHDHTGREVTGQWRRYLAHPHLRELLARALAVLDGHAVNRARIAAGKLPANGIWLWGEGRAPRMATLAERNGISGALISAVDLLRGIGVCAGMEIIRVPGATGYLDTNYQGKVDAALAALDRHDFVLVHVEAPDEAGHEGSLAKKLQAIEDFDLRVVAPILTGLRTAAAPFSLAVAMDHLTPLALRTHTAGAVPVMILDSTRPAGATPRRYTEKAAAGGTRYPDGPAFFRHFLGRG